MESREGLGSLCFTLLRSLASELSHLARHELATLEATLLPPRAAKRGKESGGVPEQIRLELIVIDLVRAVRILRELREGFLSLL